MTNNDYLMRVDDHLSPTRDHINIVRPSCYEKFIDSVLASDVKYVYKLIAILQLTTGSRISEILNLTVNDIEVIDNHTVVKIKILKKRGKHKTRYAPIHNKILIGLNQFLKGLDKTQLVFDLKRETVSRLYKRVFNITTHALRHSYVTHEITTNGNTIEWIFNQLGFDDFKSATRYIKSSTLDEAIKQSKQYNDVA